SRSLGQSSASSHQQGRGCLCAHGGCRGPLCRKSRTELRQALFRNQVGGIHYGFGLEQQGSIKRFWWRRRSQLSRGADPGQTQEIPAQIGLEWLTKTFFSSNRATRTSIRRLAS